MRNKNTRQTNNHSVLSSKSKSSTSLVSEPSVQSYQYNQPPTCPISQPPQQLTQIDDQTSTTDGSSHLWNTTSISSTNKARLHELDAMFKRQKKNHDKLTKITDDQLGQMERQFHRLQNY
jgi:hypothetical protein